MKFINNLKNPVYQVSILLLIALVGMAFPYGFPLFTVISFGFLIVNLFHGKILFKINRYITLYYTSIMAYIWGMIFCDGLKYDIVRTDLVNIVSFIISYIIFSALKKDDYNKVLELFSSLIVKAGFIIAIISLYKYYQLLNGSKIDYFIYEELYPWGTSLVMDYNMFSYALIVPFVFLLYNSSVDKSIKKTLQNNIMVLTIFAAILFSGSRRGIVVIITFTVFLTLVKLKSTLFTNILNRKFCIIRNSIIFIIFLAILGFTLNTSRNFDFSRLDTYELYKLAYRADSLKADRFNESFSQRTDRWSYAFHMINQSGINSILIGRGFDYIGKYANEFKVNGEDYPHMPLISALLYSGIFGFLITSGAYLMPLYLLFTNRKYYGLEMLVIYIISLLYFSISSNSVFSIKAFNLIQILIYIHYSNIIKEPHKFDKTYCRSKSQINI